MTVRPAIADLCPLLQVFDMPTSIAFYRDVLGFEMVSSSSPGDNCHWCWLRQGKSNLMLNTAYESDSRPPMPDTVRIRSHEDVGLFFSCDDAAAMHAYLVSRGINAEPPAHQGYGMTQVYLRDPDGYMLCFQHPTAESG